MPLVRVEVRNEYGLGMPELYMETNTEDPKAVLDGVAVAGLAGIIRQLGDLIEFATDIFHGLQEQLLITSSRSHKLVERVRIVESALPPFENAAMARSPLHFAYTPGSKWHTQIGTEQNHFIYNDLPCFIMNSYEDCHEPPHLHKLDKFDIHGPGSCFRRYSDPTYCRRSSAGPYEARLEKIETKPGVGRLTSSDRRKESVYTECIFNPCYSTGSEDENVKEVFSGSNVKHNFYHTNNSYLAENSRSKSTYVTWDETLESIASTGQPNEPTTIPCASEKMGTEVKEDLNTRVIKHIDFDLHDEQPHPTPVGSDVPENTSIQKGYKTITGIPFKEQFGNETPSISPSSPLLEHMQIPFLPIDGFQTSDNNKSNGLLFSSFQLVPTPSIWSNEFASDCDDDDDDTSCRSSSYASDDYHSNPSGSNSEQCDSNSSPRIKDHELDDEFGMSSAESISSSLVSRIRFQQVSPLHNNYGYQSSFIEDGMQSSQHGLLFSITNFSSTEVAQNQVTDGLMGPTPPPPPLPPMEWRGTNPNSDALAHPQSSKQDPRKQETDILMLQQKSCNLRRVSTAQLATSPAGAGPSSN